MRFNKNLCIGFVLIFLVIVGYLYAIGYSTGILIILLWLILVYLLFHKPKKLAPQK